MSVRSILLGQNGNELLLRRRQLFLESGGALGSLAPDALQLGTETLDLLSLLLNPNVRGSRGRGLSGGRGVERRGDLGTHVDLSNLVGGSLP